MSDLVRQKLHCLPLKLLSALDYSLKINRIIVIKLYRKSKRGVEFCLDIGACGEDYKKVSPVREKVMPIILPYYRTV